MMVQKKIDKYIEIVTLSKNKNPVEGHLNIGVTIQTETVFDVLYRHYQTVNISEVNTLEQLDAVCAKKPDLVFSGIKYFSFYDPKRNAYRSIWLSEYLDRHGVSYIGSNKAALDGEYDKAQAKHTVQQEGVATAAFFTTQPGEYPSKESIPIEFPLFIKPNSGGGSEGIDLDSFVNSYDGFQKKYPRFTRSKRPGH